ncbi:MAG: ABC transporter substrate-binding protein, partial [Eubacterium sp.]|nr:ABC transporter substrate-binding protein [Eubacterium sp.]
LGVIYCVTGDESIHSIKDLAGKTVLSTGQGATPEYALAYLLQENGITDCQVEFKSEATEIAALLAEDPMQIAILPQPFVTVAEKQNEALKTAFSLTDEWDALGKDSKFLTGVTIVRSDFLEAHPEAVQTFMEEAKASAEKAVSDVDGTAELVASYGIIEKAPIAKLALPQCNIVFLDGAEMKSALSGYLQTLFDQNPKSVGGAMPGEDFYY